MLSLEEVAQQTYNTLQAYMDHRGISLAVGPLSINDSNFLIRGYVGDLNWEYYVTTTANDPDCFSLCIKLITSHEHKLVDDYPAGVALCTYHHTDSRFDIHAVENFVKDSEEHPLRRKMVLYTIFAAVIFMKQVDGQTVQILEPDPDLIEYYRSFGFEMSPTCSYIMRSNLNELMRVMAGRVV
jgi:hypothetical protein